MNYPIILARNLTKNHKNLDFVLEKPENEGFGGQKRTKMPILCSEREASGIGKQLPAEVPMRRAIGKQLQARKHFQAGKAQGSIGKRLRAGKAQGSIGKRLQAGKKQSWLWVVSNGQVPGS